jgi:hypothetical protein
MKKTTRKQRERDVRLNISLRKGRGISWHDVNRNSSQSDWKDTNRWIDSKVREGLNISIDKRHRITLHLPEVMNFYEMYEPTALHIAAIRKLTDKKYLPNKAYRLASVNFDNLKKISTSAALVLTAELSKWDDAIRQRLRPNIDGWDCNILKQFSDLGFFELFNNNPLDEISKEKERCEKSEFSLVKYIKGQCGDKAKTRILKEEIRNIVGENVGKWTFLDSGLSEAITNVTHHAYPNKGGISQKDKNWYLTGSYKEDTTELKIVFYDQGIGIPRSLPTSAIWEKVLSWFSRYSVVDKKKHETLLRAAVELDRTSTLETDRGKGLQDLLEFIKHRNNGYLSILSLKGLYKYSIDNGKETVKSESFDHEIHGTLIIWNVALAT